MTTEPANGDWNATDQALWELIDLCADYYWQEGPDQRCTLLRHSPAAVAGPNLLQGLPGLALWETGAQVTGDAQSWQAHLALRDTRQDFRELLCCLPANANTSEPHYLSVSGKAHFDARGEFLGYHCFARDITAILTSIDVNDTVYRRSAAKLQRMYSALSATNAAILRAPDRDTLFQAVCEAVVHGGKFSVAAILTPEGDSLRPTAAAGRFSDRLLALRVPLDPAIPTGQGLAGAAWHKAEASWSNDFLEDPRSLPWREQLRAGGVLSAAAFPLCLRGEPVAELMFYSFERDTFDEEIVALLASVGENIHFALDTLETARERKEASRVLHESEERFRSLTHLSSDFFWEMDAGLRLRHYAGHFANPVNRVAAADLLGLPLWEMPGVTPCNQDWEQFRSMLQERERFRDCELRFVNPQGEEHFLAFCGEPMYAADGEFRGYRGIARDVTQRRRLAERMEFLATHDTLTGLPNRTLFNELLSHATRMATRYPQHAFALFFVDVDHFKQINDQHGHLLGDALLKEIAGRLRNCLRATDVVARLGGDEFVMLVQEVDAPAQLARLAQNVIKRFAGPLPVNGVDCSVTVSIGISVFGLDAADEHALMTHADSAMYRAKELGKNTWQFYQPPS